MKIITQDIRREIKKSGFNFETINDTPIIEVFNKNHDWDGGYESGHGYDGVREEFYNDFNEAFNFLFEFITISNLQRCIIAPLHNYTYFEKWSNISQNDIYQVLVRILNDYKIDKRTQCGIDINPIENKTILKRFVEGGFRYISRAGFFFPEAGVIVQPWHHLNLLFRAVNYETVRRLVSQTISKYMGLEMFEMEKTDG